MPELTDPNPETSVEIEQLTGRDHLFQILCGVGIASGLLLLWTMETLRDAIFRGLDLLHIPVWRYRRGSAFPPGPKRA
jgi:hypothetical protein